MITKMKKLTFLVYHKEYEEFLNSLRELGVVHVMEKQQGAADNTELQDNIRLSNRLAATLKLLQNQKHKKNAHRLEITKVKGIGDKKAAKLITEYKPKEALKKATVEELAKTAGVNIDTARELKEIIDEM